MQNSKSDRRGAKRKSFGKRKLSDQEDSEELTQQRSIPDLFARNASERNSHSSSKNQQHSPLGKRHRPDNPHSSPPLQRSELFAPDKMYNFPNPDQKAGGTPVGGNQNGSDARTAALRARAYNNSTPRPSNFTPHTGAKKLVVKNLRAVPRLNQESYFEKVWGQLDAALSAIFNDKKPAHSLEELYKGAENVCRQGRAAPLSKKLDEKCKEYVSGSLREAILEKSDGGDDIDTLRVVIDAWSTWNSHLVRPCHTTSSENRLLTKTCSI